MSLKALIVEDDDAVQAVLCKILEAEGMVVDKVASGDDVRKLAVGPMDYDFAVIDCGLPGQLNGYDVAELLSDACSDICNVLMSGYPDRNKPVAPSPLTDVPVLTKPVRRTKLVETLFYEYQRKRIDQPSL